MKKILVLFSLLITLSVQAQNADERIGTLMGEGRWFDLAQELNVTPADSVNPLLRKMALAMTYHYFNQSDSACVVLNDLLNNHQEELGGNTLSMAVLLGMNLARTDRYAEAAGLIQNLCDQLKVQGADSTQTEGLFSLAQQYHALANNAPICQPLHRSDTYRIPMKTHNTMHAVADKTNEGHFITMNGRINGLESTLVFDTGAGANTISSRQARDCGLRLLDSTTPLAGIGLQQGKYAIADTLQIGGMTWINVPFLIVDIQTGNAKADSLGTLLPPVIGLPVMLRMKEVQLDFEHQMFIIPAEPSHCPFSASNLLRTDSEGLRFATTDEDRHPLYLHFDTGGYHTTLSPHWYEQHKDEVQATGTPDSLRVAGVGAVQMTRSYLLPHQEFRLGNATAVLDSVIVNTGVDLHSDGLKKEHFLEGEEDGVLGLNLLERFKLVIFNLKEMYLAAIPY